MTSVRQRQRQETMSMQHVRSRPLLPDVVRAEMRRLIIAGEYPPGSRLPNEDTLCARFSVSRITLREAVRGLIEDGYVTRRQGSGTFVNAGPVLRNSLDTNFSYTDYLESTGVKATKQLLDARSAKAREDVATDLGLAPGADIVVIRRVRSADGKPAVYSIDSLAADLADASTDVEAFTGSIYRLLSQRGHDVNHARAVLRPVVADDELSKILQVPLGTPLQHIKQVDHDTAGRPVMHSLEWHVPSVIELRVYRRGPGRVEA